ncbi:DUF1304 domain-containing protein [Cocleimonas flava]|uniref:Putative membrane protein n=1 Tax=Cocleimonas flava TaxID=634765 RepID=A0A4R1F8J8_9GAMM|nr:DUF1304 domain-containing protein [Cocleimonas flava]MEB8431371.1 DUF1304 domain-containing protein [Cocleimonas sp. KMM 6892]MEC4713857.1 DUF1304 domain-containing protein [Cocleimonas sp. KMM 6895]MEC4743188.1 DUF1304 domain-containing protein [Cocleimonas sp. KMM 6896]TCJ89054.1 putative membrane protein [Cocleimonas flava]
MQMLAIGFTALVIVLHIYFLVLEMFLWDKPMGRRVFGLTQEFATQSKAMAANQGLYNGFLAAGLIWGLSLGESGRSIVIFFLTCVIVAGIFGALTVSKKIVVFQALPAFIALVFTLLL